MYSYQDAYDRFTQEMEAMNIDYIADDYHTVMKYLGPSVYGRDATFVACSDANEVAYIREHFLVGALGLDTNDSRLDAAISDVCDQLGTSNTKKRRPTFYYLLVKTLGADFSKLR